MTKDEFIQQVVIRTLPRYLKEYMVSERNKAHRQCLTDAQSLARMLFPVAPGPQAMAMMPLAWLTAINVVVDQVVAGSIVLVAAFLVLWGIYRALI